MPSKHINLLHRYVVTLIAAVPSFANSFKEHGGLNDKMVDRIMNTFTQIETAHTQDPINSAATIERKISEMISTNKGGDLIDLWKEICHTKNEKMRMSFAMKIKRGLTGQGKFVVTGKPNIDTQYLVFPGIAERYTGYTSVDNIASVLQINFEQMTKAEDKMTFAHHLDKILELLTSYPYLQRPFIEDNFDMGQQMGMNLSDTPVERGEKFIRYLNEGFDKKTAPAIPQADSPEVLEMGQASGTEEPLPKTDETEELKEPASSEGITSAGRFAHLIKLMRTARCGNSLQGLQEEFALPDSELERREAIRQQFLQDVLSGRVCICGQCETDKEQQHPDSRPNNDIDMMFTTLQQVDASLSELMKSIPEFKDGGPQAVSYPLRRSDSQQAYVNIRRFEIPTPPQQQASEIEHSVVYTFKVPSGNTYMGDTVYRMSYRENNAVFEVAHPTPGQEQRFVQVMDPIQTTHRTAIEMFKMMRSHYSQ